MVWSASTRLPAAQPAFPARTRPARFLPRVTAKTGGHPCCQRLPERPQAAIPSERPENESTIGPPNAGVQAAATPPGPSYYPYSFPYNSVFRLLLRWNVSGTDYYYLCSASSASDFHLISAGHCVYNHDPIGNNSGAGAGFAAEVWAWPAETDVVDPIDPDNWPDFPYGVSKATYMTTYNAWINNSDLNWDFSFISLDRRIGDHTGWMGREWGVTASALNFDGYPAQYPYVPADNPYQYPGYDANNVAYYTCCRIGLYAYIYGGHSGGPDWRFDGTNRYVEGVNSTSDRAGNAEATLLTSQIETDLDNTITNDQTVRPPTDLAQVIEYVFNNTSKGLLQSSALIGSSFGMTLNAFNAGYVDAGNTTADVYLTTNPDNVASGYYIGSYNLGYLSTYQYSVQNAYLTIPTRIPPNTYYVGYLLYGANSQYGTDRNDVVIAKETLQAYCNADAFEPDNAYTQASLLSSGGTQAHTLCPQADQDWAYFTLSQKSGVTIWTSGPSGDTTMTLYDANLNQIAFNDDNGTNLFSTITQVCGTNGLKPGRYYVQIQSYANATVIPSYNLSLSTTPCLPVAQLSATSLSFGVEAVNTASAAKSITLTNTGNIGLNITMGITGDFSQTNNCGSSVIAGVTCTINVKFKPSATGARTGILTITDNATSSPQTISLTGTGTDVKLSTASLAFPATNVGSTSSAKNVTVTNVGTTSVTIGGVALGGADPGDFTKSTTCKGALAAGANCTVTLKFKPAAKGSRTATLLITDNGGASPQKVTLTGTGQ